MGRNGQKSSEVEREETSIKTVLMTTDARGRAKFIESLVLSCMEIVDETSADLLHNSKRCVY